MGRVTKTIDVDVFAERLQMEVVFPAAGVFEVTSFDINRPAMQFAGYFEHFVPHRVQLIGNQEMGYMTSLDAETLEQRMVQFMSYKIPVIIVCNGDEPLPVMVDVARRSGVPLLKTERSTSTTNHRVVDYLDDILAPEKTLHANLVEVFNVGVLLRGESGMGKSELTAELIKRGHLMVADDCTIIKRVSENRLVGYPPTALRHLMEIRGLGIIDVKQFYGITTVLDRKSIDIIVDLEMWNSNRDYDRLGFDLRYESILGVKCPHFVIPVRPGRNIAVVVEMTAMDYRVKQTGYNIEKEMAHRLSRWPK